jgi:hypothetical protein
VPKGLHKPVYRTIVVQICSLKSGAFGNKIHSAVLGIAGFRVDGTICCIRLLLLPRPLG